MQQKYFIFFKLFHDFGLYIVILWILGGALAFLLCFLVRLFLRKRISFSSILATPQIVIASIPLVTWFILLVFAGGTNKSIASGILDPFLCGILSSIYFIGKSIKGTDGIYPGILVFISVLAGYVVYLIPGPLE